jgi:hypothetical protein
VTPVNESRSHAPAWECYLQRSSVTFMTLERPDMCYHAGAWEQEKHYLSAIKLINAQRGNL